MKDFDDIERNQKSLDKIYLWADKNNMRWNKTKFQMLRIGKNYKIKDESIYYSPGMEGLIEIKDKVKDLGIYVDSNVNYKYHRQLSISKIMKKMGWIKRTFSNRSIPFLKTLWNSLLQPYQDYGSVLTSPFTKCEKLAAEKPLRALTKMSWEGRSLQYWERLQAFRLFSCERRMERY